MDENTRLTAAPSAPGRPSSGALERWGVLSLLWALNLLDFCDRSLIVSFSNFIMPELHLTATHLGILTGFAFMTCYAFAGIISGSVADVAHRPRLIAAGMLLWSLLTAVSGFAHGFVGLLLPRIFVGIGESVLYPASLSLITDYFPSSQLALANGIFFSGVHLGAGSSLLLVGLLGEVLGWRFVFFMLGLVGMCLSLAVPLLVRELRPEERAVRVQQLVPERLATVRVNVQRAVMLILRCPSLALVAVGATGLGLAGSVHPFLQLWMVQERGFPRTEAALSAAVVFIVVGTAASPLMGALADYLYLRAGLPKASFASLLVLLIQTPSAVCFLLYAEADSVLFWASLAAWLLGGAILSPVVSTLQELAPPPLRGSVLGLAMLVMNLLGAGVGSLVIGMNADKLAADGLHHPLTYTLVMALLCSNCTQVVCFFAAGWRFERDLKAMRAEHGHGVAQPSLYTKPG